MPVTTSIVPAWAMQGLLDLILRGGGLQDVLPEAGVLLGFAVIFSAWEFGGFDTSEVPTIKER